MCLCFVEQCYPGEIARLIGAELCTDGIDTLCGCRESSIWRFIPRTSLRIIALRGSSRFQSFWAKNSGWAKPSSPAISIAAWVSKSWRLRISLPHCCHIRWFGCRANRNTQRYLCRSSEFWELLSNSRPRSVPSKGPKSGKNSNHRRRSSLFCTFVPYAKITLASDEASRALENDS
jgi:hypothetical protein